MSGSAINKNLLITGGLHSTIHKKTKSNSKNPQSSAVISRLTLILMSVTAKRRTARQSSMVRVEWRKNVDQTRVRGEGRPRYKAEAAPLPEVPLQCYKWAVLQRCPESRPEELAKHSGARSQAQFTVVPQ